MKIIPTQPNGANPHPPIIPGPIIPQPPYLQPPNRLTPTSKASRATMLNMATIVQLTLIIIIPPTLGFRKSLNNALVVPVLRRVGTHSTRTLSSLDRPFVHRLDTPLSAASCHNRGR